ncbi:helix-turn-helix domain-containing protein [Candidatus Clostridium radicumherbarum]|uniref:Helix-turn-helix domain-containing protein n=1 Tax=Candidatus Clostridium radicumherbarum TaxID=3381662 RepID=A0ABW8TVM6_9CLOT
MEFLEIRQKIKRTRKELNMKQKDFEDVNISRALISMIEIGKRKPSKENMESIIYKFKKKSKELNLEFNLDLSYFQSSAKDDAQVYCTGMLNRIISIDEIIAVIEIAKKYALALTLADAYLKLADIRFEKLDYANSQVDYINALVNYKNIDCKSKITYIYDMLGRCCINQAQNIQALNYFNFAYHYSLLYKDEEMKKKSIYNIALCHRKLDKIDDALKYIDIYISICDKEKDFLIYSYANILKANCYDCKGELISAIEVLNDLLEHTIDTKNLVFGYIYNNLGALYCKQGYFEKSLQCFNMSEEIRSEKDIQNLSHTLLEKSSVFIKQNLYEESITLIKSSIDLAIKYNDIEYILKGHYQLIKIYKTLKFDKEVKENYIRILNLLTDSGSKNYKDEIVKICVELLRIFLSEKDIQQSLKILDVLETSY